MNRVLEIDQLMLVHPGVEILESNGFSSSFCFYLEGDLAKSLYQSFMVDRARKLVTKIKHLNSQGGIVESSVSAVKYNKNSGELLVFISHFYR